MQRARCYTPTDTSPPKQQDNVNTNMLQKAVRRLYGVKNGEAGKKKKKIHYHITTQRNTASVQVDNLKL